MSSRNANGIANAVEDGIKVNPHYESLVPQMSDSDYNSLKESIRTAGQYTPIIVNQDNVVIDGHHRLRACRELGIAPRLEKRTFSSKSEEMAFAIERNLTNLQHRRLNNFQKIELAYRLEEVEADKAHKRQMRALKKGKSLTPLSSIELNGGEKGRVAEKCATIAGVSPSSYKRGRQIILQGSEELKEKARSGQLSILQANHQLWQKLPEDKKAMIPKRKPLAKAGENTVIGYLRKQTIEMLYEGSKHMTDTEVMWIWFSEESIFEGYVIRNLRSLMPKH